MKYINIILIILFSIKISIAEQVKPLLPDIKQQTDKNLKIETPLPTSNIITDAQKQILAQNYVKLGDMYSSNQEYTRAFYNYKKAYELEKKEDYIYKMAEMLLKQNKRNAAKQLIDEYYKLNTDSMLAERIGLFFYKNNEYSYAEEYYKIALYLRPASASVHYNLGLVYFKIGDLIEAEKQFKKAIDYNVGFYQAYYNLALVYFQQNKLEKAEENFNQALTIRQDDPDIYFNLGIIYVKKNNDQAAIEAFEKALLLDKNFKEAAYNLAVLYKKTGQVDKAEKIIAELEKKVDVKNTLQKNKTQAIQKSDTITYNQNVTSEPITKELLKNISTLNKRLEALTKREYQKDKEFEKQKKELLENIKTQILSSLHDNITNLFEEKIKDIKERQILLDKTLSELKEKINKTQNENKQIVYKPVQNINENKELKNKIDNILMAIDNINTAQKNNSQTINLLKNQIQNNSALINDLKNIESNSSFLQIKQDIEDISKTLEKINKSSESLKKQISLISEKVLQNEQEIEKLKNLKDIQQISKKLDDLSLEQRKNQENIEIFIKQMKEKISILEGKIEFIQLKQSLEKQPENKEEKININTAGYDELMTIAGMSSTVAQNILWYRQNIGYFKSIEELQKVPSMTYQIYQIIKDYVTIR